MAEQRYKLQQILGKGGMGTVHLALDTHTGKKVALKVLRRLPEDPKTLERFEREINIALTLDHPHVLRALARGYVMMEGNRLPYLVSPYMPEGNLEDLIYRQRRPPWRYWKLLQIGDAIQQAAAGLEYMHSQIPPIIHRDVKPGNFLIENEKGPHRLVHLYLSDFGISRQLYRPTDMASGVLGTYAYMAPEQVSMRVDAASDQYALAIMACFLLTGHFPLRADNEADFLAAHLYEQPQRPSFLNPQRLNSSAVDHVILKALAKKPEDRFPSIADFSESLYSALQEQIRSNASAETLVVNVDEPAGPEEQPGEPSLYNNPLYSSIAYEAGISHDEQSLDEPLPAHPLKPARPIQIEAPQLERLAVQQLQTRDLPGKVKQFAWSPDGLSLACSMAGREPVLLQNDGVVPIHLQGNVQSLCWSPDSHYLAFSLLAPNRARCEIRFWAREARAFAPLVLTLSLKSLEGLDWSAQRNLAIWADNQVLLYNLPATALSGSSAPMLKVFQTENHSSGGPGGLSWSPDGMCLVAGSVSGSVICWRLGMDMPLWQKELSRQRLYGFAWYPDSSAFAAACGDKRVVMLSVQKGRGEQIAQWDKLAGIPRMVSISTQRQLAVALPEQLLFGDPNAGHASQTLDGQLLVAWSPDSRRLATLDARNASRVVIWGK